MYCRFRSLHCFITSALANAFVKRCRRERKCFMWSYRTDANVARKRAIKSVLCGSAVGATYSTAVTSANAHIGVFTNIYARNKRFWYSVL